MIEEDIHLQCNCISMLSDLIQNNPRACEDEIGEEDLHPLGASTNCAHHSLNWARGSIQVYHHLMLDSAYGIYALYASF